VLEDAAGLERMIQYANGRRKIPVIVEGGNVTIGFDGS
jgi:glutaredoxin